MATTCTIVGARRIVDDLLDPVQPLVQSHVDVALGLLWVLVLAFRLPAASVCVVARAFIFMNTNVLRTVRVRGCVRWRRAILCLCPFANGGAFPMRACVYQRKQLRYRQIDSSSSTHRDRASAHAATASSSSSSSSSMHAASPNTMLEGVRGLKGLLRWCEEKLHRVEVVTTWSATPDDLNEAKNTMVQMSR